MYPASAKKKKNILAGRWASLANGALCLSTTKHNGKSGTVSTRLNGAKHVNN